MEENDAAENVVGSLAVLVTSSSVRSKCVGPSLILCGPLLAILEDFREDDIFLSVWKIPCLTFPEKMTTF